MVNVGLLIFLFLIVVIILIYIWLNRRIEYSVELTCNHNYNFPPFLVFNYQLEYNKKLAYQLMCLNLQTTLNQGCGKNYPIPPNFSERIVIGKIAYLYLSSHLAILSFTGTATPSQWFSDLEIKQVAPTKLNSYQPGQLVHEGFYRIYLSLREQLKTLLASLTIPLIITGHSLGGALAGLAFVDLVPFNTVVYSFASPRIGNDNFSAQLNKEHYYRIFNSEDIVPMLPLPVLGKTIYSQGGQEYPFTLNLGSYSLNHNEAYLDWLKE